jgi:hypothetical protein
MMDTGSNASRVEGLTDKLPPPAQQRQRKVDIPLEADDKTGPKVPTSAGRSPHCRLQQGPQVCHAGIGTGQPVTSSAF